MFARGVLGGVIGAGAGALVWGALTHFLNVEVGYVAWGIGAAVGFLALAFSGGNGSPALGASSAVIALLGVAVGKIFAIWLALGSLNAPPKNPEQAALSILADSIIEEHQAAGKPVIFPPGKNLENALGKQDYPPAIWAEAETRWQAMSAGERELSLKELDQEGQISAAQRMEISILALRNGAGLSLFDLLWVFLAVSTAFKLGSGGESSQVAGGEIER
ncbi:MAG: hypothetical protein ACK6D3_15960 [Planctomycetaceae bacterium]|jgi:hypothetical protein